MNKVLVGTVGLLVAAWAAGAPAPHINTWLVAGPFDNDAENTGFDRDWLGEAQVSPREGDAAAGTAWRYFDDRLFSRNYDAYQDLFSFFRVKLDLDIAAKGAYAHVYVHSSEASQAHLRLGADNAVKAWCNGVPAGASTDGRPERDMLDFPVALDAGWNRLLLKVGNQTAGRFGFYARLTDETGHCLPGLTYSVNGPGDALQVSTKAMAGIETAPLPVGYREWPYVGARVLDAEGKPLPEVLWLRKPEIALLASEFMLSAEGGEPPYRWSLVEGTLPEGLSLGDDGAIRGTVAKSAALGDHAFTVQAQDAAGQVASKPLALTVKERPNRWFEEARLTALIHSPETLRDEMFDEFAQLMKRQGYGIGMVISYNNGKHKYRWPSIYEPDCPLGDVVGKYKRALEAAGVGFGMYIGNLNGANHGGDNGAILLVEDAMRRYNPAAFWFDWAGWNAISVDAVFSMIRSYNSDTVIVLNGIPTISNGDWDVVDLEGWNAWGEQHWHLWPMRDFWWPKHTVVESWRYIVDPEWEYAPGILADWRDYLRIQIALIGEGHVANIDHSPSSRSGLDESGKLISMDASPLLCAHRKMAQWVNPPGLAPLHESYTGVNPGPLREAAWGCNVINTARDAIYLHLLETPYGKTGVPEAGTITVGPVALTVAEVEWMNRGEPLPFEQNGQEVTIDIGNVAADPIDTIVKLELEGAHPDVSAPPAPEMGPVPPGNLAWRKPARLLSNRADYDLPASSFHFACYGVDGVPFTFACGGNEWDWTFHVDLEAVHNVDRIVIHLARGYPTEYEVHLSVDGETWHTVAHDSGHSFATKAHTFDSTPARYVRIKAIKPNGPDQEGVQMHIAELEVYEARGG